MRRNVLQQDRQNRARVSIQAADETIVSGQLKLYPGEVLIDIRFPVMFAEEPFPSLGMAQMQAENQPENAFYPIATGTVVRWATDGGGRYTGATIAIKVSTGKPEEQVFIKYRFEGVALSNGGSQE